MDPSERKFQALWQVTAHLNAIVAAHTVMALNVKDAIERAHLMFQKDWDNYDIEDIVEVKMIGREG